MGATVYAFWRRIDQPGHDIARLARSARGWSLEGYAVFREHGPTGLRYRVELAADYSTLAATITGHRQGVSFTHEFGRTSGDWHLDGKLVAGLDDLIHLDFGFTPSTNFQQVHHAGLAVDQEAEISAAWFDIGEETLLRLPQRYRRIARDRYWYSSPMGDYEAVLEMAPSGFVRCYPGLWELESDS